MWLSVLIGTEIWFYFYYPSLPKYLHVDHKDLETIHLSKAFLKLLAVAEFSPLCIQSGQ